MAGGPRLGRDEGLHRSREQHHPAFPGLVSCQGGHPQPPHRAVELPQVLVSLPEGRQVLLYDEHRPAEPEVSTFIYVVTHILAASIIYVVSRKVVASMYLVTHKLAASMLITHKLAKCLVTEVEGSLEESHFLYTFYVSLEVLCDFAPTIADHK